MTTYYNISPPRSHYCCVIIMLFFYYYQRLLFLQTSILFICCCILPNFSIIILSDRYSTEISIHTSILLFEQNEFGFADIGILEFFIYHILYLKRTRWFLENSNFLVCWTEAGPQPVRLLNFQIIYWRHFLLVCL